MYQEVASVSAAGWKDLPQLAAKTPEAGWKEVRSGLEL